MSTAGEAMRLDGWHKVPAPILDKMRKLIRRVRRITLVKGILAVAATALISLLTIMAVDAAVTIFSPVVRWGLTAVGFAVTGVAAWWWIVRPASRRITLASIARFVEERHPELQETLSSAIELMSSDDPDEIRGSRELIAEVVKAAEREAARVSPSREIDASAIRNHAVTAMTFAAVLGLVFLFWPSPAKRLVLRAVAPFLEVGNAYADTLTVEPGDVRVPLGAPLQIKASVKHPRLNRATVRRLDPGSKEEGVERMGYLESEGPRREFVMSFPSVTADFTYRVHAGSAVSRFFQVTAVAPPSVESLRIRIEPPLYTGLSGTETVWEGEEIAALENSTVTFLAQVSREVAESRLLIADKPVPPEPEGAGHAWIHTPRRGLKAGWRIELKDSEGFGNDPTQGTIRADPDLVPMVRLTAPEAKELRLRPTEVVPLAFVVTEDFGFSRIETVVEIEGRAEPVLLTADFPARAGAEWSGRAVLDLASLDLAGARSLKARVRVADNLPVHLKGPQTGESEPVLIRLESGAKPLAMQVVDSQDAEIRKGLEEVRRELQEAKSKNEELRREVAQQQGLTPKALERLNEARRQMTSAEGKLVELAERMEPTLFRDTAREMAAIAEGKVQPAQKVAELIPLTDTKEERVEQAAEISKRLDEATKAVAEVLANLGQEKKEADQVAALGELARQQELLARKADEQARAEALRQAAATGEEPAAAAAQAERAAEQTMREWLRDQQQVEARLAEMVKESPEALRQVLKEQQQEAARLAERSLDLAEQQEALRQATAMAPPEKAEAMAEAVMRQLQAEQKAIAQETGEMRQAVAQDKSESSPEFKAMLAEAAKSSADAAGQLQKGKLEPAAQAAAKATEKLEDAARASQASAAQEMVKAEAAKALEAALPSPAAADPAVREAVGKAAEQIAAAAMPAGAPPASPEAVRNAVQAAAAELARPEGATPEAVAKAADQAARAVAEAAQASRPAEAPGQPTPASPAAPAPSPAAPSPAAPADPATAGKLAGLADRQSKVTEALDALNRGQVEEALAGVQEALTEAAGELLAGAQAMERTASLTRQSQAQSEANQAGRQFAAAAEQSKGAAAALQQAQTAQDQAQAEAARAANPSLSAEEAMAQARSGDLPAAPLSAAEGRGLEQAGQAQQRTRDALAEAARRLEQSGQSLAQAAEKVPAPNQATGSPSPSPVEGGDLAQSFQQASQAARAADAAEAASQAAQAAQSLQQMARQAAQTMGATGELANLSEAAAGPPSEGAPAQPSPQPGEFRKGLDAVSEAVPPELAKLGISVEDWARIKGSLRPDITTQASSGAPQEYREMVSDYFRIIATEAGK